MRGPKGPRRGLALDELSIIPDGALLVRDGVVLEVGPTRRVENLALARDAVEINAAGRVVMPGFVDSHTHLAFPLLGSGSGDHDAAARAVRANTGQRLEAKVRAYLEAMARHGTTTVEIKTGCGPDESAESKMLRVLSVFKQDPVEVIPSFLFRLPHRSSGDASYHEAADWVLGDLLPKIWRRGVAQFADVAWDSDPECYQYFDRYLEVARGLGFPLKMHADHLEPQRALAMAVDHAVVSIDHLEYATEEEAAILGPEGVIATLLPCASFRDDRDAPARGLVNAGAAIALATNFNPHHTPTLNMQTAVALACLRMRLTVAEALSAATINGAHALGCADRVGSLEPGKSADLLMLNVADYRDMAHTFGTNVVHMTMKRGEVIYWEGAVTRKVP
ncbi:MAG TPA: amidohydrolase family protein [Candidatus Acidoferrales bacterium]|nr:amidohydrolase family protein [Candidatus Acidoferrales bacterium]